MTEREKIIEEMAQAIFNGLEDLDDPMFSSDEWSPGPEYYRAADKALRVIETPPSTKGQTYAKCNCGNNGYTEHDPTCPMHS